MEKNLLCRIIVLLLMACSNGNLLAQIPEGYYDSLKGKN